MADVDWREMFRNYVAVITGEESITYLERAGEGPWNESRPWTPAEKAALDDLLGEWRDR